MENKREEKHNESPINAIDYIKNSAILSNMRYVWIKPLIINILEDNFRDAYIKKLINSLLSKQIEDSEEEKEKSNKEKKQKNRIFNKQLDHESTIKKILRIDCILNVGLLNIEEPIELKDGLNVFYGKNGAGKSSIYLGLCKALGKNKKVYHNISAEEDKISYCKITFETNDGKKYASEWKSGKENPELKVMIFDSSISNYIVEEDQINQFRMVHLKAEYFSFLYNLYQQVEEEIQVELITINTELQSIEELLLKNVPIFSEIFIEDDINKINFTQQEVQQLGQLEKQINILEKDNTGAVLRNIKNALEEVENILLVFGKSENQFNEETGENEFVWEFLFDNFYFERVNTQIKKYNDVKKAFENSGKNKISSLIPPDWINKKTWENFISSSIDFLDSLTKEESKKYLEETCVYCHQSLHTKEAKTLIKAYQELHEEYRGKLNQETQVLKKMYDKMTTCIDEIKFITNKNKKIETEFENIGKKGKIDYDFESIKSVFQKYKDIIERKQRFDIYETDIKVIHKLWDIYRDLSTEFREAIDRLEECIINKTNKFKDIKDNANSLRQKKALYENKNNILKYFKLKENINILNEKLSDISAIRHTTSSLKTSFSQEATINEFKKNLQEEYRKLRFSPPQTWNIKPITRDGINKRVYNIGDRKLADIFSEGERNLHAFSDFFAQCTLNNYRGIFIFDDPINSLDEDNIEIVAERISELVENNNQVIVFTHNLYFLNSIIDTQKQKITKVERSHNQINLIKEISIGETQELKDRMKKIDSKMQELSTETQEEIDEYDLRNVYDLMSGYLEDYVEKVYFKNVISRYRPNIRMQTLGNLKDIDTSVIDNVLKLYKRTSRKGARHSQPLGVKDPQYSELVNDIKELKENFHL
jgi:DNA repair exonuclease SbcCD ATPase subunit